MEGKVALFNMWDRAFTEDEVNSIDCLSEGNLLSMSDMSVLGPANLTEVMFHVKPVRKEYELAHI